jgi:hypothetical protein
LHCLVFLWSGRRDCQLWFCLCMNTFHLYFSLHSSFLIWKCVLNLFCSWLSDLSFRFFLFTILMFANFIGMAQPVFCIHTAEYIKNISVRTAYLFAFITVYMTRLMNIFVQIFIDINLQINQKWIVYILYYLSC